MFDALCIILALFLYRGVRESYRNIAFVVLCWFVISDLVFHYLFLEFRADNDWAIYQLYNLVNVVVLYKLVKFNAFSFLIASIGANVLLNIVASAYFISNSISTELLQSYTYPAGAIMLVNIMYLWIMGNGTRPRDFQTNNRDSVLYFLFVRHQFYSGKTI